MSKGLVAAAVVVALGAAGSSVPTAPTLRGPDGVAPAAATPIVVGETLRVQSKRLGEERDLAVFLPSSYAGTKQRFPVIYALDGEGTGPIAAAAARFLAGYPATPRMPEALVVAILNTDRNRDMPIPREYGSGREGRFLAFLADELLPLIEARYRTQPLRILLGHSQGGLLATYALATRPDVFQWYLSLDAPLAGFPETRSIMEKVTAVVAGTPSFSGRLVSIEALYGWRDEWRSLDRATTAGLYRAQIGIEGETHETMVYKGIYEGLGRLFHDYTPEKVSDDTHVHTLAALERRYGALSRAYGYRVDIPREVLLEAAAQSIAMQLGGEAVELVERAVALYGESPATGRLRADAREAATKGRDPRLAEWANLRPPGPGEMAPFLGTWEEVGVDRARELVTFEVEGGVVRTTCAVVPPGGEPFEMEVRFVRVLAGQSLQWGLRNGRGAGIILRTVRLVNGDTLEGTGEPVGIPHAPAPHPVTYRRRPDEPARHLH